MELVLLVLLKNPLPFVSFNPSSQLLLNQAPCPEVFTYRHKKAAHVERLLTD